MAASRVHEDQTAIEVADPGRFPPPPDEAYRLEFGNEAYEKQKRLWERDNRCARLSGCTGKLHGIGCPRAKVWRG